MTRTTWALATAVVFVAVVATVGVVVASGSDGAPPTTETAPASTVAVRHGDLSAVASVDGMLTYRAQADGSPYAVVNQTQGIYTSLPQPGAAAGCGDALYRVDDRPVLLLCGRIPAYRGLRRGDRGRDVRQLNRNLHDLGYRVDPGDDAFTAGTRAALRGLQRKRGLTPTGTLAIGAAVVLPGPIRVAKTTGTIGGVARPGAPIAQATSDTLEVQVQLDASLQGQVKPGDRADITLPGLRSVRGTVARLGRVAQAPGGRNATVGGATIVAHIRLADPRKARGLDRAPVRVEIATAGVRGVLSVPALALVGRSGGGYAVEVVGGGGARSLVPVELGLFDATSGSVEVAGNLHAGDRVVVPAP